MIVDNPSILNCNMSEEVFKPIGLDTIQLNIDSQTLKVIEIIQDNSKNINIIYEKNTIILNERKRQCPHCKSRKVHIHDYKPRKLHFFHMKEVNIKIVRYQCQKCKKTFVTNLKDIVKKSANFTNDFKNKLLDYICESEPTLFAIKYSWENTINNETKYNSLISHQSIENYILELSQILDYDPLASRGYLIFDVQWVKLRNKWKYRFSLFDVFENRIIADKIYDNENNENITEFLTKYTHNITVKCITTDLALNYRKIIEKLGYKHQYCLFHTKQIINKYIHNKIKRLTKTRNNLENKIEKQILNQEREGLNTTIEKYIDKTEEILKYKQLKKQLYHILNLNDYEKAQELTNKLYDELDQYTGKIKHFIKNRLHDQFKNFKQYTKDENIEKTSNKLENAFSKTMSKKFKRKYRTNQGILARIYLNELRYERNKTRRNYYLN